MVKDNKDLTLFIKSLTSEIPSAQLKVRKASLQASPVK